MLKWQGFGSRRVTGMASVRSCYNPNSLSLCTTGREEVVKLVTEAEHKRKDGMEAMCFKI